MKSGLLVLLLILVGCAEPNNDSPAAVDNSEPDINIQVASNNLRFDGGVTASRGQALNEAISLLYSLPMQEGNSEVQSMIRMMGIESVSPRVLQSWLEDRVHYVVNDNFDFSQRVSLSDGLYSYENPTELPDSLSGSSIGHGYQDSTNATVMMTNIGAALYAVGKKNQRLVGLNLAGIGKVSMTSPRVGVLSIGAGMFPDLKGRKVQNVLLDIMRTSTLFHEARHSDGHGKTLGFLHSKCPSWHDLAGMSACDAATNGPYTIDAKIHKNLMDSCSNCTELTMRVLRVMYADVSNRVLSPSSAPIGMSPKARAGVDWDDAPEGHR